jgi:hypothetical protein
VRLFFLTRWSHVPFNAADQLAAASRPVLAACLDARLGESEPFFERPIVAGSTYELGVDSHSRSNVSNSAVATNHAEQDGPGLSSPTRAQGVFG